MRYHLATLWRRARNPRRREVVLRKVEIPSTLASDLYASSYRPVIDAWSATTDAIVAAYGASLAELMQDSPEQIGATISTVEAATASVLLTVRAQLQAWAARVEQLHRRKWRGAVLSATGVDIDTMIGAGDMRMPIGAAIERNVGLISSVSEQARTRIGEAVFRGLQRRAPAREVAAEIREAVAMGRRRALNIASDQTVKLASALNEERAREAGIEGYAWVASGKVNYRPEHKARNGKIYRWDKPPSDGPPGTAINCGCTSRARLSLDENDEF